MKMMSLVAGIWKPATEAFGEVKSKEGGEELDNTEVFRRVAQKMTDRKDEIDETNDERQAMIKQFTQIHGEYKALKDGGGEKR